MKLNELRDKIHENAKRKGFYNNEKYIHVLPTDLISQKSIQNAFFAQKIALIHSELSEALEADRKNKHSELGVDAYNEIFDKKSFEIWIKDSVEDEIADVIIRTLDLCGYLSIDIEKHIELKMRYNEQREYKHRKNY